MPGLPREDRVKSNVLPFPSLRSMPPDPPRWRWWHKVLVAIGVTVVAFGLTVAAVFLVWLVRH